MAYKIPSKDKSNMESGKQILAVAFQLCLKHVASINKLEGYKQKINQVDYGKDKHF